MIATINNVIETDGANHETHNAIATETLMLTINLTTTTINLGWMGRPGRGRFGRPSPQQQLRNDPNFTNANPSNELEEESICQDAVQNFEGRGPGPGSEHWLLGESNNVFDAEALNCDQLQHHTDEPQETQENFYQEF